MSALWSWLLGISTLLVLALAGRPRFRGLAWLLGLLSEPIWVLYATLSQQWGFLLTSIPYTAVYALNLKAWTTSRQGAP